MDLFQRSVVFTPELDLQKCEAVFAHVEQAYPERDQNVDATV